MVEVVGLEEATRKAKEYLETAGYPGLLLRLKEVEQSGYRPAGASCSSTSSSRARHFT
jgi:hypothetical protein